MKVAWFSAGVSSAVATKLVCGELDKIIYIHIDDQHPDTMRFVQDCEKWFKKPITILQSPYKCVENAVFAFGKGYIGGPRGAICTRLLKKRVRKEWELDYEKIPIEYFWGMDIQEQNRVERLIESMPNQAHKFPLIEQNITKEEAHKILAASGIERPVMYKLGYRNNNCVGCVKGGMGYWNKIRIDFPEVFNQRAIMERKVGASCINGVFLDELDPQQGRDVEPICDECGILCEMMRI